MLIRASAKFQRHYGCVPDERDEPVQPFPQTWNVDILAHSRSQLLVLTSEEYSLFSFLIPVNRAQRIDSFFIPFRKRLVQLFENTRLRQRPDLTWFGLSGRTNRRVIGSQNDLLFLTSQALKEVAEPALPETLQKIEELLNSTPMSYLEMISPAHALSEQLRLQFHVILH